MHIFKKISPILSLLFLVLVIYFIARLAPSFLEKLSSGFRKSLARAPEFVLQDAGGNLVKLSDFRGQKVILSFWTSWNNISLEELKILNDYVPSSRNLSVLAVNSQEELGGIQPIIDQNSNVATLLDKEGSVGELYDISVLPLTIFIDKNGFVANRIIGPVTFGKLNELAEDL